MRDINTSVIRCRYVHPQDRELPNAALVTACPVAYQECTRNLRLDLPSRRKRTGLRCDRPWRWIKTARVVVLAVSHLNLLPIPGW